MRIHCWKGCSCLLLPVLLLAGDAYAGAQPAIERLADALADKVSATLIGLSPETVSLAVVVEGDQAILGQEGRIAQELERLLVFRLEAGTAVDQAYPLGASGSRTALERAIVQGATWLLRCVVGVKNNDVHLTADLMPARMPFWDRLVDPVPRGVSHHLFESVKADEEIMLLLGKSRAPPALGSWHLEELLYLPRRIIDLGLGDLDGDGSAELVVLLDDAIEVYGLSGDKLLRVAHYGLEQVPEEVIRTRDPTGSLLVVDFNRDGRFEIFYRHFNRRFGEVLTFNGTRLMPVRRLGKVPLCQTRQAGRPVVLYGKPEAGTNRYEAEIELTDMNASVGRVHRMPGPFVTLRCWQVGDSAPWMIAVEPNGGLLRIGSDWQFDPAGQGAGAGSGVMDLDQDGLADLVLSDAVEPGAADSLRVVSQGEWVWRSKDVVGGVVAVAGGDLHGTGKVEAVVAAVEPGGHASRVYLLGR